MPLNGRASHGRAQAARWLQSLPVLSDRMGERRNNLNLLRMVAAISVLVSHSYPVCRGGAAPDPVESSLGYSLGTVAVFAFFIISGHLIACSWERSPSASEFWIRRIARIVPGLLGALLLTILLGALATSAPMALYWPEAVAYVLRNVTLYHLQPALPGLLTHNPIGPTINGSLWTLSYEVTCYFGVVVLGSLGVLHRSRRAALAVVAFLGFYTVVQVFPAPGRVKHLSEFAMPFMVGVASYVWRRKLFLSWMAGAAMVALAILARHQFFYGPVFAVALGYLVLLFAFKLRGKILAYNNLGDYSYGVYIYAFPVQQILVAHGLDEPLLNAMAALPIVIALAVASWTFVEEPALMRSRRRTIAERLPA